MDLSLRGSQINLAERNKPKAPTVKYPGLNYCQRPGSASYSSQRRSKSVQAIKRPLSADERVARSLNNCIKFSENILNEGKLSKSKKYSSVSSSNLLKLLIDEPIRRPWLCRESPDSQKGFGYASNTFKALQKARGAPTSFQGRISLRKNSSSYEESNSSIEEDLNYQNNYTEKKSNLDSGLRKNIPGIKTATAPETSTLSDNKMQSNSTPFSFSKTYKTSTSSSETQSQSSNYPSSSQKMHLGSMGKPKSAPGDFWHETKPDLPGRVSFSKADSNEHDVSDIENEILSGSSADSNFILANTITTTAPALPSSASTAKKVVHFDETNGEVQAQTFEYPKCPSENCSCSNRSSISTVSAPEKTADGVNSSNECTKCICDYSCNSMEFPELSTVNATDSKKKSGSDSTTDSESTVIKDYINAIKSVDTVGEEQQAKLTKVPLYQTSVESTTSIYDDYEGGIKVSHTYESEYKFDEPHRKSSQSQPQQKTSTSSETRFTKNYDTYYVNNFGERDLNESRSDILSSEDNTKYEREHLNNFSSNRFVKRYTREMYEESTVEPATRPKLNHAKSLNNIGSERVITNYLKVAGDAKNTTAPKKKVNNNTTSNGCINAVQRQQSAQGPKRPVKPTKPRRSKSASVTSSDSSNRTKIKKCGTYSCLREDSNLDEFELDKIDSWMSMHSSPNSVRTPQPSARHRRVQTAPTYSKISNHRGGGDNLEDHDEEFFDSNESPETSDTLKSDDNSQDGSTYDEIVSVIKEIEEETKMQDSFISKHQQSSDVKQLKDVNIMKLQSLLGSAGRNSHTESTQTSAQNSPQSSDKFKDILTYLEDVENDCDRTLLETRRSLPETNRSEIEFTIEPDIAEDVPKLADLLMLPNHQLARRVISLSLRANELANGIQLSKQHIQVIRQEKQKAIRLEKQSTTNRLKEQKKHFESIIARHQGFIEQLLKDKTTLCEKVTTLTRRIDSQNQAWEHKMETELARTKETTLAGEKIRRERWVRENTKKIKELTVKGLESEINRMQMNHQQEINDLKRHQQQELLNALDEARLKHEQNSNQIRQTLAQDREMLIEKERNAIRERFEKQLEEERKSFDEQKIKIIEGFAHERDQILAESRQKESEFTNKRQEILEDKETELKQTIEEYQEKLMQQDQKYQVRINTIEKQFESDFIIWKREYENTCKLKAVENENAIRQHYRTERDRQIDAIVSRMDAESQKCQEEYEAKLSRLKEKFDNDIEEAESVEKSLRDKYNETRGRLAESEAMTQNYQSEIKQLQMELSHSKKMNDEFLDEKEKLKENARNDALTEIANIKAERDKEIQKIYKRVQQAIEKKDSTVDLLQKENGTLRERCIKLEAIIRQQRKDYCIK